MRRYLVLSLATAALPLSPLPALAHARLVHAEPGVGTTVSGSRGQITLQFSEGVVPGFSGIALIDAAGKPVETGKATGKGKELTIPVPGGLKPGQYEVRWHAVSVDTHKTQGSFRFTVAP